MSHDHIHFAHLLSPHSIAIVGASRFAEKLGHTILRNAISGGFSGPVHIVNPHGGEILGHPVTPHLNACPRGVELVVLAVPAAIILEQAKLAISRGCKALVVLSDGFSDLDAEGTKREQTLAKLCRERDVPLLGPNSLGVIHRRHGLNGSLTLGYPPPGEVALLTQSGAIAAAALEWMAGRNLGLSKMISPGNEAGLTMAQCLSYLTHDPETRVIACHLERITDGAGFLRAATEASRGKPVVLLLGGSSEWRNTNRLDPDESLPDGPAGVFAAACDRTGIIQAHDFQGWLDCLMALSHCPTPQGERVAVISNGMGPGLLTADLLAKQGFQSVGLAPSLATPLKPMLPDCASLRGPLDLCGVAQPDHFLKTLQAVEQDDDIHAVVAVITPQPLTKPVPIVRALLSEGHPKKPLLTVLLGGTLARSGIAELDQLESAGYSTPERAAEALSALLQYGRWRGRGPRILEQFSVNRSRVRRLIQRHHVLGITHLSDLSAKEILHAYGIQIPEGEIAATLDETLEIAERVGYPVSLHLISPELHLASEMDTRHVDLPDPRALRDGFDLLTLRFARLVPEGRMEGIFVEKNVTHGRPASMGMIRDRQFGPLLHVGGPDPMPREETISQLAPVTSDEALAMLRAGCRQQKIHNLCAEMNENELLGVAEVLQRLSQLAIDFPEIRRVEINPLIIRRAGLPPVATACELRLQHEE
ncbi:MAG: CoA-binding protein [Magnetococcales bacterium]|nr:acetate--CoA ligase family protein [Magnetococcales bacterium]NGZ04767.1 CoA-binding protein [Magnetococcales bacterium]